VGAIFTDGNTPVEAAEWNKLVKSDGNTQFQILGYRIYYSSGWNVWSLAGNTATVSALALSWDNTLDKLDIDLSGLSTYDTEFSTGYPAVVVSPSYRTGASPSTPNYIPQAHAIGVNDIYVRFFDIENAGVNTHVTTIGTQMDFNMILFGHYDT
jgi:hypothetical protein